MEVVHPNSKDFQAVSAWYESQAGRRTRFTLKRWLVTAFNCSPDGAVKVLKNALNCFAVLCNSGMFRQENSDVFREERFPELLILVATEFALDLPRRKPEPEEFDQIEGWCFHLTLMCLCWLSDFKVKQVLNDALDAMPVTRKIRDDLFRRNNGAGAFRILALH